MKEYYIGSGDYFGDNSPNPIVNNEYLPRLLKLGIKEKNIDEVVKMFTHIYDLGYSNGVDNERTDD